jgi:hypothetical protein
MTRARSEQDVVVLVAEAGVEHVQMCSDDPIGDWIELMEVVEALCPEWPQREPLIGGRFEL